MFTLKNVSKISPHINNNLLENPMSDMILIYLKNRPKFVKRMKKTSIPEVFYVFKIFKLM